MAVNLTLWVNCRYGNLPEVQRALETDGADPNSVRSEGDNRTCLHAAAHRDREEVVALLLEQPTIDVNRRGGYKLYNGTALHGACTFENTASLRRMVAAHGVDYNSLDQRNWTPIMVAVHYGATGCVRVLSAVTEVDLDCKYGDGQSLEERWGNYQACVALNHNLIKMTKIQIIKTWMNLPQGLTAWSAKWTCDLGDPEWGAGEKGGRREEKVGCCASFSEEEIDSKSWDAISHNNHIHIDNKNRNKNQSKNAQGLGGRTEEGC